MKKQINKYIIMVLSVLMILTIFTNSHAANYYVDATIGNDDNSGLSEITPWKTINKVNSISFNPGDSILFKRGNVWREYLIPHSGDVTGYITYGAYGIG